MIRGWIALVLIACTIWPGLVRPSPRGAIAKLGGGTPAIFPGGNGAVIDIGYTNGLHSGDSLTILDAKGLRVGSAQAEAVYDHFARVFVVDAEGRGRLLADDVFELSPVKKDDVEVSLQTGHSSAVKGVAFANDGKLLYTRSNINQLFAWEVTSGTLLARRSQKALTAFAIAPNRNEILTGDYTGSISIWDSTTFRQTKMFNAHRKVGLGLRIDGIVFDSAGDKYASVGWDNAIRVWDAKTDALLTQLVDEKSGTIDGTAIAISPTGDAVASSSQYLSRNPMTTRCHVVIWSLKAPANPDRYLECNADDRVQQVAYSPNGLYLAALGDRGAYVWDVAKGYELHFVSFESFQHTLAFAPDGSVLATGDSDGNLHLIQIKQFSVSSVKFDTPITAVGFGSSPRLLALGFENGRVGLFDPEKHSISMYFRREPVEVNQAIASADSRMAALSLNKGGIQLWDLRTGHPSTRIATSQPLRDDTLAFTPDSKSLLYSTGESMRLRYLDNSKPEVTLPPCKGHASVVFGQWHFSPDGRFVVGTSYEYFGVWDFSANRWIACMEVMDGLSAEDQSHGKLEMGESAFAEVTDDGKLLVGYGPSGMVRTVSIEKTGVKQQSVKWMDSGSHISLSHDGQFAAVVRGDSVVLVHLPDLGKRAFDLQFPVGSGVAFSHDSTKLAAMDGDTVRIYDTATGSVLGAFSHQEFVKSVSFSADDRLLITAAGPEQMTVWQLLHRQRLATVLLFHGSNWVTIDPDGFFDGPPSAWGDVLFHTVSNPMHSYEPERFFNLFFEPGLLAQAWATRDRVRETLVYYGDDRSKLDVRPLLDSKIPTVQFVNPKGISRTGTSKVAIRVQDTGSGVRDCRIFRDGISVFEQLGRVPAIELSADVDFSFGHHSLSAYCFNDDGLKSHTATASLDSSLQSTEPPRAYIVGVGINDYGNPSISLSFAENDARDMVARLGSDLGDGGRFKVVAVPILGAAASKDVILEAISRLSKRPAFPLTAPRELTKELRAARPADVVIVFFAGHGMFWHNQFYLLPQNIKYAGVASKIEQDAQAGNVANLGIAQSDLEKAFAGIDAGHIVLIVDACSSGSLLDTEHYQRLGPFDVNGFPQMAYEKGLFFIASAQTRAGALEHSFGQPRGGNGLLARALAWDALGGNKRLTAGAWLDGAAIEVPRLLEQLKKLKRDPVDASFTQTPRVFHPVETDSNVLVIQNAH